MQITYGGTTVDYPYRLPHIQLVAFQECTKCHDLLPSTTEYFPRDVLRQQGFTSQCRTCTKAYQDQWRADNLERAREMSREGRYRRKARISGAEFESFPRREIFKRDNWICGICGELVDENLAFPDPMSATLDHVHPLAHGGAHSRENVQCAHWSCNSRKGARVELAV